KGARCWRSSLRCITRSSSRYAARFKSRASQRRIRRARSAGAAGAESTTARVGFLDLGDLFPRNGNRIAAVLHFADEIEFRFRAYVTGEAIAAEAVDDVGESALA